MFEGDIDEYLQKGPRAYPLSGKVAIDIGAYDKYLKDSQMTTSERREFLEKMWCIIVTLMEVGFVVRPAQKGD
jgi:hypothetical protein